MVKFVNRCKHVVASAPGTGNVQFGAAKAGFQSLAQANVVDSDVVRYTINDGDNFESGTGVIGLSGSTYTMARTPVTSSNSDNAITATADAEIFLTALASDIVQFADDILDVDTTTAAPVTGNALMWNYATSKWTPATPPGVAVVATTTALLAISSPAAGAIALVTALNKTYMYDGTHWQLLSTLANQPPTGITGVSASYVLSEFGADTVITANSTDPELFPLTWSYAASGLGSVATISQADNVFTITPSASTQGTFTFTITATDSAGATAQVASSALLQFSSWANPTHQQTILPPSSYRGSQDGFGVQTAMSGDGFTLAIAYQDPTNLTGSIGGEVHIYTRTNTTWSHQYTFIKSDSTTASGTSVPNLGAMMAFSEDGDTLAIGCFKQVVGSQSAQGRTIVLARSGTTWTEQLSVTAPSGQAATSYRRFAYCDLSNDGNTLVVGSNRGPSNSQNGGMVAIYTRSGSNWTEVVSFTGSDTVTGDIFSHAKISGDGSTIAVMAPGAAYNGTNNTGAVYIYAYNGTSWSTSVSSHQAKIDAGTYLPSAFQSYTGFGDYQSLIAISDDGDTVAFANEELSNGEVYVVTRSGTTWTKQATILPSSYSGAPDASNEFGCALSLSGDGNKLAVGAKFESSGWTNSGSSGNSNAGSVYTFLRNGTTWSQASRITNTTNTGSTTGDNFGAGLCLSQSGYYMSIGTPNQDIGSLTRAGAVQIYVEGS